MKVLKLHSCLAPEIHNFISLRQLSGTDYQSQAQMLGYFDRFLVEKKLREPRVPARSPRTISKPSPILACALSPIASAL